MSDEPAYEASPWGARFHARKETELLGAGSAGPGKTIALLMDPLEQILVEHMRCADTSHPHRVSWGDSVGWALHLRRTLKQLVQSIQKTHRIFPKIDPGVRWIEQEHTWVFSSGYRFQFGHCKDKDSWQDYFSNDYTHLGIDEAIQFEKEQYDQLYTRVRATDPVLRHMLKRRLMSNPMMVMDDEDPFIVSDAQWVRDRFVDPWPAGNRVLYTEFTMPDGTTERVTRLYLPAKIDDNPNKQFARDYRLTLMTRPLHIQKALLEGDWYFIPSAYFGAEWDSAIHTCNPFRIPEDWLVFRSMDWGHKKDGCIHWWALDPDDTLFCVYELIFQGKMADEVAAIVKDIEQARGWWEHGAHGGRSRLVGVADPQLWEERGDVGPTKAVTFLKKGVPWIPADRSNRRGSASRLLERLRDHAQRTKTPGIVFFKTCVKAIKTIPIIPADPNDPEMPLDGGYDHPCDSARYACSYAARGRLGMAKMRAKKMAELGVSDEYEEIAAPGGGSGRYGYGEVV